MNQSDKQEPSNNHVKTLSGVAVAVFILTLIVTFLFIFSGYGYQYEIWELGTAFSVLRNSAYAMFGLILVNLLALYLTRPSSGKRGMTPAILGLAMSISVLGTAIYWQNEARSWPAIHDITTDTKNPPQFNAIVPLRADAPNPPEYLGGETTSLQNSAYPDITTLEIDADPGKVFEEAVRLVEDRGWELVSADRDSLVIEATETLAWFGFKDDVVIRIRRSGQGSSLVDIRSKSRIGGSDLGMNAWRIRQFLADLNQKM